MARRPRYTEAEARAAVAASVSYTEALRRLGMRPAGGNHATLKKYVEGSWRIPTEHFDPNAASRAATRRCGRVPLAEVLVEHSTYSRGTLKKRLYAEGLKRPICELCGQGEIWRGRRMSLILDHITAAPQTTGSRTSGSSARIAPRRSIRTAESCPGARALSGRVRPAARSSTPGATSTVTAHIPAGREAARGDQSQPGVRSSGHHTSGSSVRSPSRATSPSGAATACQTMPFASGCASTSARRRRQSRTRPRPDYSTRRSPLLTPASRPNVSTRSAIASAGTAGLNR